MIYTERLLLRPLMLSDLNAVHEYASDGESTKYMMFLPHLTIGETEKFLRRVQEEWQKPNPSFYEWGVESDGVLVGSVSLYLDSSFTQGEIGWIVGKKYRNLGYATEAAKAVLSFSRERLHLHKVVAQCDSRNAASEKVMKKIGMTLFDDKGTRTYVRRGETAGELTYMKSFIDTRND